MLGKHLERKPSGTGEQDVDVIPRNISKYAEVAGVRCEISGMMAQAAPPYLMAF